MPQELTIADIQAAFLEYRANFKEPITPVWFGRQQGEIINAIHSALAPWQLGFENISWNQAAKTLGETHISFAFPSLFSSFLVGVAGVTITALNPDWSRAQTFVALFQTGMDALTASVRQGLQSQQLTLGFHVKPGGKSFRETVSQFVNAKALESEKAAFFGASVYYADYSFVVDSSVAFPGGVFVKLTRNFAGEKPFDEMAATLYKDEESVLRLLGLKLK
ncbi:MAG TPA: hypothetical protein VK728_09375 [Candidatus Sulfotelmatobacter sp.]|jgi:hypothetical protein|nr:hypothetical protein [Candidatus Sulfotelmatobacter sp.]